MRISGGIDVAGLMKEIRVGETLEFELTHAEDGIGFSSVSIRLTEVVGRKAIFNIVANKEAIPIKHVKVQDQEGSRGRV
jgi:hypothetical protein